MAESHTPVAPPVTVPEFLRSIVERFGPRDLIVHDDERVSYAEIDERSARFAARLLAAGVGKGTRVGLLFPNEPSFVVAWLGVARIGAVAVPFNTMATASELRDLIRHADLQHLVAVPAYLRHEYVDKLAHALPELLEASGPDLELLDAPFLGAIWFDSDTPPRWARSLDAQPLASAARVRAAEDTVTAADTLVIVLTSGSTGAPKAVIHSHGTLLREAAAMLDAWEYGPVDRIYTTMPFFWVGGLSWILLTTLAAGAAVITSTDTAAAAILEVLERERVTFAQFWPHTARAIAADPTFPARSLRIRGGSLHEAWLDGDPALLANGLGMTETGGPHTRGQHRLVEARFKGSFGQPIAGMEHRIVDVDSGTDVEPGQPGELLVRGDTVMVGLHRQERHTVFDVDGWYHTGDFCTLRDGHLFFHGRVDDQMKVSGVNVSPSEIEQLLLAQPGVLQAFVAGVPDLERGAVVAAAVVAEPHAVIDVDGLIAAGRERLSSYKVPRIVTVVTAAEIPMKTSGKVDRLALVEMLSRVPRLR